MPATEKPFVRYSEFIFLYFNFPVWKIWRTISTSSHLCKFDLTLHIKHNDLAAVNNNDPVTGRSPSHGSYFKPEHINICDIQLMFWLPLVMVFKFFNGGIKYIIQKAENMWQEWKWTWVNTIFELIDALSHLNACHFTHLWVISLSNKAIGGRNIFCQRTVHQWA